MFLTAQREHYLRSIARNAWLAGYTLAECLRSKDFLELNPMEQRAFSNELRIMQAFLEPRNTIRGYWK